MDDTGQAMVTVANAVAWAIRPSGTSPDWHRVRLSVVRCFARHLSAYDPSCQSRPPPCLHGGQLPRHPLHLFGGFCGPHPAVRPARSGRPLPVASCEAVISTC